jgi:sterol 3beta-glucosyltransferase
VGPKPIPRKKLSVERLAAAIRQAVEGEAMRQNAAELGKKIRSEDGVGNAVRLISQLLEENDPRLYGLMQVSK